MTEDKSLEKITAEIRSSIAVLRENGQLAILKDMLGDDLRDIASAGSKTTVVWSAIEVTSGMHIIVPDRNNAEIKMPTLARSLYIFYLLHPEGVAFKHLGDYRKQIFSIYRMASNRSNDGKLTQTINRLVNPLDNKVNECASRIKDAFVKTFGENAACMYYLTNVGCSSDNVTRKAVKLPSTLIKLPENLLGI